MKTTIQELKPFLDDLKERNKDIAERKRQAQTDKELKGFYSSIGLTAVYCEVGK